MVANCIEKERRLGRILGPFPLESLAQVPWQTNRIGVIPKGSMGKWRLITDLSHPPRHSVSDAIDTDLRSLLYTTVERVAQQALCLGKGAMMAKVDIELAYCLAPVTVRTTPSSDYGGKVRSLWTRCTVRFTLSPQNI